MAVQAMAGRRSPHGGLGCNPLPWATIGCGRDAGISGSRAAAPFVRDPHGVGEGWLFCGTQKMPY